MSMTSSKLLWQTLVVSLIAPPTLLFLMIFLIIAFDSSALASALAIAFHFVLLGAVILGSATLIGVAIAKLQKSPSSFSESEITLAIAATLSPIWLYPIYVIFIIIHFKPKF